MPAPVSGVVSGSYQATWNALAVGNIAPGGFKLNYSHQAKMVYFDGIGTTPADSIMTGLAITLDFVCMEYNREAIKTMSWPFHGTRGKMSPTGRSMWDLAKPFIMTACVNTVNPVTLTFPKTFLAPDFNVEILHSGTNEKVVPMRLIVLPCNDSNEPYVKPVACSDILYFIETLAA